MSNFIFVTGGAGYIGSHACKALRVAGYVPVTLDNLSTGWRDAVKFGPFELVDLLNKEHVQALFDKYRPASVIHFAALSEVGESVNKPGLYWRNNVLGSLNLIDSSLEFGCEKFIFSSTCATYGDQDNVLLDENTPQFPLNPYGSSKRTIEEIIKQYSEVHSLKYVIFRYFNVAGADSLAEVGEFHRPETHLIPIILDTIYGKRDSITVFGADYDTHDGTCIRDFVHVCDLVDAHILGLKWLEANGGNRTYNLGTGEGFSVMDVIKNVQIVTNREVPFLEGPRRPGDCSKLVSGSELAKNELGWNHDRSSLKQMITDAWRWHQIGSYSK